MNARHALTGWLAAALLLAPASAPAQTIRPPIAEHRISARSSFELVNPFLRPLDVTLDARSFSIREDGEPEYGPLAPGVHLRLSEMSFRIPPRQSHVVFYEARAEQLPAWFTIYATVSEVRPHPGLRIELELPHTVYLLQPLPLGPADVSVSAALDPASRSGTLRIENRGPRLGRVRDVRLVGCASAGILGGFPLPPGGTRLVPFQWEGARAPDAVRLEFSNFTVRSTLTPVARLEHDRTRATDGVASDP